MILWQLFSSFFRIGCFTIGGGYAMLPLMQKEVVDNKHWLTENDFVDMLALVQSAPGVIAVNTSVFVGYRIKGITGAIFAALGCILPSFIMILCVAYFFSQFNENEHIIRIFKGIRPAVVALIAASVVKLAMNQKINVSFVIILIASTLLIWLCSVSPVYIIIAAAIWGIVYYGFIKKVN